jgi:hypothetical protein
MDRMVAAFSTPRFASVLALLWLGSALGGAAAQTAADPAGTAAGIEGAAEPLPAAPSSPVGAPADPADSAGGASSSRSRPDAAIERRVFEDEGVRIEELRVRGQVVRVTVQSKVAGAPPYEVNVGPGGRDPSQERDRAGQSAWRLFSF